MRILAIETSCDDTAICLAEVQGDIERDFKFRILGNAQQSQVVHTLYGGVFPNLAKREHARNLVPMLAEALRNTKGSGKAGEITASKEDLRNILARESGLFELLIQFLEKNARPDIDAIAVTVGPGLEPALWTGINFAKALGSAWGAPIIGVNHMEGHFLISLLEKRNEEFSISNFQFPILGLLISGGHTELVLSREFLKYEIIGKSRDDAVGEAFDKVARMLGLPYPGGPHISALAEEARKNQLGSGDIKFPRPMLHSGDLDFSFAGLKTAVKKIVDANQPLTDDIKRIIAREFEDTVAEVLLRKTLEAVETHSIKTVVLGGGVSANIHIRRIFTEALAKEGVLCLISEKNFTTDNAVMIVLAGYFRARKGEFTSSADLKASGSLALSVEDSE
ncbi:MAG TPA: tRNA (adenosine(37)-N6)-threonylcarbamoyltransferase complex transferase subunit TsaD [Candidatus Paceibacterota bacterium]